MLTKLMTNNKKVEFMTKSKFSKEADLVVAEKRISYLDAVLHLCEQYGIDPSDAKKYVSTVLKGKIEVEAMNSNCLKIKRSTEAPLF